MITLLLTALAASPHGHIAFVAGTAAEGRRVAVIDLATGHITPVGPGKRDGAPRWSPDGDWLAFETAVEGGTGICVVRADGSDGRFLRHAHPWNHDPRWSADGRAIAYSSGVGLERKIAVYDLDAAREEIWGGGRGGLLRPVWLPDPRMLPLLASPEGLAPATLSLPVAREALPAGLIAISLTGTADSLSTDIYVVTRDDAFPFPEAAMPSKSGRYAEWAAEPDPRGRSIAFESNDGGDREIFVATIKGALDVSNHRAADWGPVWSPTGEWLAFESFRDGRRGVYRVHRDTSRVYPIAADAEWDAWAPAWSPDGRWLAYVSNRDGESDIYVVRANGGETRRVTTSAGFEYAPAWRPVKRP